MTYVTLLIAIFAEVVATTCLKLSDGFSRPIPSGIAITGYGLAFYCLSLTLRTMPTGIAYALWCGVGIVLITAIAWVFQGQKLDAAAFVGMGLIVAGVLVLNLLSDVAPR
jgi:multidrug transporter EmrE-like cation transporter